MNTDSRLAGLIPQLAKTLELLKQKYDASSDPAVESTITAYKQAIQDSSKFTVCDIKNGALDHLLNRARGYLETSSEWDQPFLHELGRTEELIKDLAGS